MTLQATGIASRLRQATIRPPATLDSWKRISTLVFLVSVNPFQHSHSSKVMLEDKVKYKGQQHFANGGNQYIHRPATTGLYGHRLHFFQDALGCHGVVDELVQFAQ